MNEVIIDNKKYVFVPIKNYTALQKKAALKIKPEKTLTVEQARLHSKKLIHKWAAAEK